MNILHIMQDYKPRIGGSVVRNASMIEAYKRNLDDNLYLVNLAGKEYISRENINDVEIYRCKTFPEMVFTAWHIVIKKNIQILHAHNYRFMFAAFIVRLMCPQKELKIITEMHSIYRMTSLKEKIAYRLLRKSDAVIVLADSAKQYLVEKQKVESNIITSISNGLSKINYCENREFEVYKQLEKIRDRYCIAAYFGTFYAWQGVLFIAENIDKILSECTSLYLVMIGDGPDFSQTEELIQNCKYKDRILLCESIEKEQLYNLYDLIDIILIPRLRDLSTDTAIPLKAVEAMEFSRCILAANDNGLKEILNEKNARLFTSGDIDDFLKILKELLLDKELRIKLGKQAKKDSSVLFHTWDSNSLSVKEIYKKVKKMDYKEVL